jgi:hypothetical protein
MYHISLVHDMTKKMQRCKLSINQHNQLNCIVYRVTLYIVAILVLMLAQKINVLHF